MKRLLIFLVLAGASVCRAQDFLDTEGGHGWSPDSKWVAFNTVGQNDLFFIAPRAGKTYLLKPVGDIAMTGGSVFSANVPGKPMPRSNEATTLVVPAPGKSKLEIVEWSADSKNVAYKIDRKTRGVFSLFDEAVTGRAALHEMLPWQTERDLRAEFELVSATGDRPARLWLRVQRPDATVVKQIAFDDPKEVQKLGLMRFSGSSFLSGDKQFVLYPKLTPAGWQLMLEPVGHDQPARALTEPAPDLPLEWRIAPDSRHLAIVENLQNLIVGAVDKWERAEKVPLPNIRATVRWSPDSRFLACNVREKLFLLPLASSGDKVAGDFIEVSKSCASKFWGWRGTKLLFNDFRNGATSLYLVDAERPGPPVEVVKPRRWQSAPRERTISPDGTMFVCLMMEQDSEGRLTPQVWKIDLREGADWERLYTFKPVL